ncbi:hypothetical protein NE237_001919 [Protea cynaroides]|uniref:Uncharacterized protein n=1 Tax=Protea cynaroides TaxID=273540 RepID=A0A9Q0QYK3_9MAGN|nr:hypothetical protein NE237_001919 [Protea cynaroides]
MNNHSSSRLSSSIGIDNFKTGSPFQSIISSSKSCVSVPSKYFNPFSINSSPCPLELGGFKERHTVSICNSHFPPGYQTTHLLKERPEAACPLGSITGQMKILLDKT